MKPLILWVGLFCLVTISAGTANGQRARRSDVPLKLVGARTEVYKQVADTSDHPLSLDENVGVPAGPSASK